jgi:site-specific recombinase XerD
MRHTFATGFMMARASQKAAMRQLGQTDLKSISRYQHMVDAQLVSVHKAASPVEHHFKKSLHRR